MDALSNWRNVIDSLEFLFLSFLLRIRCALRTRTSDRFAAKISICHKIECDGHRLGVSGAFSHMKTIPAKTVHAVDLTTDNNVLSESIHFACNSCELHRNNFDRRITERAHEKWPTHWFGRNDGHWKAGVFCISWYPVRKATDWTIEI